MGVLFNHKISIPFLGVSTCQRIPFGRPKLELRMKKCHCATISKISSSKKDDGINLYSNGNNVIQVSFFL